MPLFIYKARKSPTELLDGELQASSQDEAVMQLEKRGLSPISVLEKSLSPKEGAPRSEKETKTPIPPEHNAKLTIKTMDLHNFTRQLASLHRAGVPLLRALTLLAKQTDQRVLKALISDLERQIKDGKRLSESMQKYPSVFNRLYISMIQSGERGGVLNEVLQSLVDHQEKEHALKRKVQAAIAYPMLMLVVGIGTIFLIMTFFLPKMILVLKQTKQVLPLPTKILVGFSHFMSANWYWFIIAACLAYFIFGTMRPGSKKKFLIDFIKLHVPIVKDFVKNSEIAKFTRTLNLLLKNGLPVHASMVQATSTLDNEALRTRLLDAGKGIVQQGVTLSQSIAKTSIFPEFVINMISVGEEGGKLEDSLHEIADQYEKEVELSIKIMTSLIEPLLILSVGAVVGFIVFAMLLPIFEMGQ